MGTGHPIMKLRMTREHAWIALAVLFVGIVVSIFGWRTVFKVFATAMYWLSIGMMGLLILFAAIIYIPLLFRRKVPLDDPKFRAFVLKQLSVIRPLGFFKKFAEQSDEEVFDILTKRIENEYGYGVRELMKYPARLASVDQTRFLWEDLEGGWFEGNDEYIRLIKRLAKISRGCFQPVDITEDWEDEQSVTIRFKLNGEEKSLRPKVDGDWLDPDIFGDIDKMVAHTGYRFLVPDYPAGQDIMLVVLNDEERKRLNQDADWQI
jgi:hypothetical protein